MKLAIVPRPGTADPHRDIFAAIERVDALLAKGKRDEARLWLRVVKKLANESKGAR